MESNLNDLFQIECDAANAMMKIRFGPTPTRCLTQKWAGRDPKKVGWGNSIDDFSIYRLQVIIYLGQFYLWTHGWSWFELTTRCLLRLCQFWCHVWRCPASGHGSRRWNNSAVGMEYRFWSMWNDLQQKWSSWRNFYFIWNLLERTNKICWWYFLHSSQPGQFKLSFWTSIKSRDKGSDEPLNLRDKNFNFIIESKEGYFGMFKFLESYPIIMIEIKDIILQSIRKHRLTKGFIKGHLEWFISKSVGT